MELEISNVIEISVSESPTGLGEYNTSNLAIFTAEKPGADFGSDGFKIYVEPSGVEDDFGTDSIAYAQALAVFSQRPNILAGNGYLVVITMQPEVQTLAFSGIAASGDFKLNFGGDVTAQIDWDDTASEIQTKVRTLAGLEGAIVTGSIAAQLVTVTMWGYLGEAALMTVTDNDLNTSAPAAVTVTVAELTSGETLAEAISRTQDLVQYFGIICTAILDQTATIDAATVIQTLNKIGFFVQILEAAVEDGGIIDLLRTGNFTQSRGLYYGSTAEDALSMMAAYAGRGLSTNFDGSNTTSTMHLKDLIGIQPDPTMTQTILNKCKDAGADTYVSIQGVAKVFCSGANKFFDQVYNLLWFVGDLQIAGFNYLATTSTKIPQTENGVQGLVGAYRGVCEQAVTNAYSAPGVWNSPVTFGNQQDLLDNVAQRGYYLYAAPIAKQSAADRAARKAPLIQIALKEAGAIHSSTVIVNVNA